MLRITAGILSRHGARSYVQRATFSSGLVREASFEKSLKSDLREFVSEAFDIFDLNNVCFFTHSCQRNLFLIIFYLFLSRNGRYKSPSKTRHHNNHTTITGQSYWVTWSTESICGKWSFGRDDSSFGKVRTERPAYYVRYDPTFWLDASSEETFLWYVGWWRSCHRGNVWEMDCGSSW